MNGKRQHPKTNKHEFALFVKDGIEAHNQAELVIDDQFLVNRMTSILRLNQGDMLTLFDRHQHIYAEINEIRKKNILLTVLKKESNQPLSPSINWFLPLLEKEAFEESISILTVLGATLIQPLVTSKTHKRILLPKDYERLERIMVAAAEQSKQFVLPTIGSVIPLDALEHKLTDETRIFFEPSGISAQQVVTMLQEKKSKSLHGMVGPEGDLTDSEKEYLKTLNFTFCALTPSILRAEDAVSIGMGILRSFLRDD